MCALVCPVKAITHEADSIQINEGICIGCKMCALACPFGDILPGGTPVPGQELNVGNYSFVNTPFQPDPMFLRELSYQEQLSLLKWNIGQKTVAIKCDLCYFRPEGPACVIACPHKALVLVESIDGKEPAEAEGPMAFQRTTFEKMKEVATLPGVSQAMKGEL
jgi:hydrogenase-4 component A